MQTTPTNTEADQTLSYYEQHAAEFARDTAQADVGPILQKFTSMLSDGGSVLDWGCGTGRDSRALADAGLTVTSVDASPAMCQTARELFGVKARCERFVDLRAQAEFDGIWACASLLHVHKAELPSLLQRACAALKPKGVLYASFKYGNYQGMRGGRWYTDLDEAALKELALPCFDISELWVTADVRPGREDEKWLNCLLTKRS